MITRMVVQTTLSLAAMGAILFLAAGDWRWPQGWVFLGELGLSSFAVSFWLLRHDPALLESRMSAPVRRDQMPWDRIFMLAVAPVFIGWMVLIALDARRFGWSHVPLWAQALGAVLIALGMVLVWQTFRFNTFAAPQVRVQAARAHRVITDGAVQHCAPPHVCRRHALPPRHAPAARLLVGRCCGSAPGRRHGAAGRRRGADAAPRALRLRRVRKAGQVPADSGHLVRGGGLSLTRVCFPPRC